MIFGSIRRMTSSLGKISNNIDNTKLIVILGSTAVGKTKLSIELAKMFDGEIISADSMQVSILKAFSIDLHTLFSCFVSWDYVENANYEKFAHSKVYTCWVGCAKEHGIILVTILRVWVSTYHKSLPRNCCLICPDAWSLRILNLSQARVLTYCSKELFCLG